MKQIEFSKKLRITKKTIADLNSKEMNESLGGVLADSRYCISVTACYTQCPSMGIPCAGC